MRSAGSVDLGLVGLVQPVGWLSNRLLVGTTRYGGSVIGVDVVARRSVWQRTLDGMVVAEAHISGCVVLVVRPNLVSGPARVFVIRATGPDHSIALDRLLVAAPVPAAEETRAPGLAVDAATNRAYVVGADGLIAEIDLEALTVAYHGGERTLAKVGADRYRQAVSLGNGMLAVTGTDWSTVEVNGGLQGTTTPAGLYLVKAETGAARLLQHDAAAAKVVGRSLLAYGAGYGTVAPKKTGSGLTVYELDGTLRAHLFGAAPVSEVKAYNGLAYVSLPDRSGHIAVVDPAAGRVLRTISRPSLQVLAP
jgi:hypothetical protein